MEGTADNMEGREDKKVCIADKLEGKPDKTEGLLGKLWCISNDVECDCSHIVHVFVHILFMYLLALFSSIFGSVW